MHPNFFGDSYDLVKREIIHGLAPTNEWATHPMYFDFDQAPEQGFVDRYAQFLGIALAERGTSRDDLVDVATACPQHLFLDPDTGLWDRPGLPNSGNWDKHVRVGELVAIANAHEHRLMLIFDQGYSRIITNEMRGQRVQQKLQTLRHAHEEHEVHGVAYVSHAVFIWVSTDADLLARATQRLLNRSGLPLDRFVDDGCGRNHIEG